MEWTPWLERTTDTSAALDVPHGGTYCLRVRAHDADGLIGSWSGGPCVAVPTDDRELVASPEWTAVEGDGFFGGTALRATAKGATIRITDASPGSLGILATTCGGCGTFVVRSVGVDCAGTSEEATAQPAPSCPLVTTEEVDLRGARADRMLVFAGDNGEEGFAGPIDIVVTSNGKPVIIDAAIFNLETE